MVGHKCKKAFVLDNKLRRFVMPVPEVVLKAMEPKKTDMWVDIGSGTGFYTIPLASMVHKVYGVDINDKMLKRLREKIDRQQITNIEVRQSQENSLPLDEASTDGVFLAFVVHELNNPNLFFPR